MYWITPDGNYYVGDHVAEGSIPISQEQYESRKIIPQVVSRYQARGALLLRPSAHEGHSNMLTEVDAFMTGDAVDPLDRLAWIEVREFKRNSPTILSLAPLLGLTDDDLDNLFIVAATIDA